MKTKLSKHNLRIITMILFALLNIGHSGAYAQFVLKEADQQFEHFNYNEAAKLYLKAWKKKEKPYTAQRLGESYRKMSNYQAAEEWYARLSGMSDSDPQSKIWYADALKSLGKYQEAKVQYQQYAAEQKTVPSAQLQTWISSCDSAIAWMAQPKQIKLENQTKLNSIASDWAAVKYGNGIVFTSDRAGDAIAKQNRSFLKFDGTKMPDKQLYHWTGSPYTRLYYQENDQTTSFPLGLDQDYYTGTVSFTGDGKEAFFTMTSTKEPKKFKQAISTIYIGLYSSRQVNGKWTPPKPFRYTDVSKWSVGDPSISPDGQVIYFVSDMPGGYGGTDIYKCTRNADSTWSEAVNLGPAINTAGNERSPAVYQDLFFFSSDGHIGMGGLDIFQTSLSGVKDAKVMNMGYPMNSPQDDFATTITGRTSGFISSNRDNGTGKDDIYAFELLPEKPVLAVSTPLLVPAPENPVHQTPVVVKKSKDSLYLENIYYNFDKANIRYDAEVILQNVYRLMEQYPDARLLISSHTDSKGPKSYNQHLSQQRAAAVVKYFTKRGILRSRIKAEGFGERFPAAPNTLKNGKDNPKGRQLNRRSELRVKALLPKP